MARLHEYQGEAMIDPVKHGYDGPPPGRIPGGNPKSQDPNPPLPKDGLAVASPKEEGKKP